MDFPLLVGERIRMLYYLLSDSPARNYASAPCPFLVVDQRDLPRLTDDDGNNTAVCDTGAYEFGAGIFVYLPMIIK